MDITGENVDGNNNSLASDSNGTSRSKRSMRIPQKQFISHMIIVVSVAFIVFMTVFLLAQNNIQNDRIEKLAEEVKAQNQSIKEQTDINQRYLRCILLIEREKFTNVELRVDAIDKCSIESRLPNGESSGTQPTSQEQQDFEAQPTQDQPAARATQPPQASAPATPQNQPAAQSQPANPAPAPQPSVVELVTKPIEELVRKVL